MFKTPMTALGGLMLAAALSPIPVTSALAVAPIGKLTVTVTGLKSTRGAVMVALFDTEAAYSSDKPLKFAKLAANADRLALTFDGLEPGRYAIKAFHDLNEDGKLQKNPFGVPSEPYAFSNGAKAIGRPPAWSAAAFSIDARPAVQTLTLD